MLAVLHRKLEMNFFSNFTFLFNLIQFKITITSNPVLATLFYYIFKVISLQRSQMKQICPLTLQ